MAEAHPDIADENGLVAKGSAFAKNQLLGAQGGKHGVLLQTEAILFVGVVAVFPGKLFLGVLRLFHIGGGHDILENDLGFF